jgi:hypothetical protein
MVATTSTSSSIFHVVPGRVDDHVLIFKVEDDV